jgi:hypothetical protein
MRPRLLALAVPPVVLATLGVVAWYRLVPTDNPQPLPPGLISLATTEGQDLLDGAEGGADYPPLAGSFETQALTSFCGVASAVTVLSALGVETTQRDFFTPAVNEVRPRWRVVLTGMPLDDLAGLIAAHGPGAVSRHADTFGVDDFRAAVAANLAQAGDYLLVNYQRGTLGQDATGHISPIAAYDADTDSVLILDTASYRYPMTWVPLSRLYEAMRTVDPETEAFRGYVEVTAAR